jgi:hypothetical protein
MLNIKYLVNDLTLIQEIASEKIPFEQTSGDRSDSTFPYTT